MTGKRRAGKGSPRPGVPVPGPRTAAPSAPAAPVTVGRRSTRRELRAERRRQRRRRFGAGGIVALVVLVLAVLGAGGFFVHSATSGSDKPTDPQSTMLLTVQGPDRTAVATVLLAHTPAAGSTQRQGLELLVPSRLLTDVCGFGSQQFGRIVSLPDGPQLARTTLSQVLGGVTIDSTASMTTGQLAKLVDGVGGVTVDVDTDVITSVGGVRAVAIPQGPGQRLSGARAVQFATYVGPGEPPSASLSRFQTVFEALVTALPAKASQATRVLTSGGLTPAVATRMGALFTGLAGDDRAKALLPITFPTQTIDAGGGTPSYRVDTTALKTLVSANLTRSLPAGAGAKRPTVLIENGVGTPGLVLSACNRLLAAGYGFAGSGNAQSFNYPRSQVFVFDTTAAAAEVGNRVAALLHLPQSDVVASTQGTNVADVVVILGRDYKP